MASNEQLDMNLLIPLQTTGPSASDVEMSSPENWYAEPFTKRTACRTPGQCGGDCDCGCPYNMMTNLEQLPLIEEIAAIFPDEWLAFIISADEDDAFEPIHGKLVAHSRNPDEVYDAVNTVLWNQHVYVYFNGDFEAMQQSYGDAWDKPAASSLAQRTYSGPKQVIDAVSKLDAPPEGLIDLVYSALDQLYGQPDLNETIRRLRLARVRAANAGDQLLLPILDSALDQLEAPLPRVNEVTWFLEEALLEVES